MDASLVVSVVVASFGMMAVLGIVASSLRFWSRRWLLLPIAVVFHAALTAASAAFVGADVGAALAAELVLVVGVGTGLIVFGRTVETMLRERNTPNRP